MGHRQTDVLLSSCSWQLFRRHRGNIRREGGKVVFYRKKVEFYSGRTNSVMVPALAASVGVFVLPVALFPPVSVAMVMVVVPVASSTPVMAFGMRF